MYAAFDTGSRFTGYCIGDGTCLPECGVMALSPTGSDIGAMLLAFDNGVRDVLYGKDVRSVAFEAPILNPRRDRLIVIRKLYALTAHVEFICARLGIPCCEVDLRDVKRELAGFAKAEKSDMVAAATKLGVKLPDGPGREDAADACGVWLLLLRKYNRAASARFDGALYGSRGALL